MNFNTLRFMSLRFTHVFFRKVLQCKPKYVLMRRLENLYKLRFYGIFAFAWTLKKSITVNLDTERQIVISNADDLFENCHYEQCYNVLKSFKDQEHVEIQWRLCRVIYNMSKELEKDVSKRKEMIAKAFDIISGLLKDNGENYAIHKWYAILLDAKSENDGIKERIKQLENIRKHMDIAVMLNPSDATTLHMLGEWCYQIADMPWYRRQIAQTLFAKPPLSTYEDALEYFLRAESAQPRFYSLNLLRIGNCYLKQKKDDQAKYYLVLAASYPAKSNDDFTANKEATELLKNLK